MAGSLFIVATPIGNLDDITKRAVDTLAEVDLIAAEDTRHSKKLLTHLAINTRMFALHDHNEKEKSDYLISLMKQGSNIALISDAGTPLISDPGYHLVNQCREQGIRVVPIPGPSAVVTALCAAGLPSDRFAFMGFFPAKQKAKQDFINEIKPLDHTVICYESPRRLKDTLQEISSLLEQDRILVLAKELTKNYEQFCRGSAIQVLDWLAEDESRYKGEMVLLIKGIDSPSNSEVSAEAMNTVSILQQELPLKKAAAMAAQIHGLKKNALYKAALEQS